MYGYNLGLAKAKVSAVNVVAPTNSVAPVISGTAVVGQVLTTTNGTWSNNPSSFSYQWKRGATNVGTNASTYTLVQADAGNTSNITCVVTATNAGGSANATSNQIAQVLDADLNTYMTAAAITSSTIIAAENNFFVARKNISSLSNVLASHHLVTDKSTNADRLGQFKFNAYSPVDANVNKRLIYTGTVTANTTGMQGSANGFANTFINPSTDFTGTDHTVAFVIRTNSSGAFCDFSALSGGGLQCVLSLGNITYIAALGADGGRGTGVVPNTSGIFILKRSGSSITLNRNNVLAASWTDATSNKPNLNLYYMARNSSGAAGLFSTREYSFFEVINAALTTQQETNLYNAILTRENALGR